MASRSSRRSSRTKSLSIRSEKSKSKKSISVSTYQTNEKKINYREELVLYLYHQMLPYIIESWTSIEGSVELNYEHSLEMKTELLKIEKSISNFEGIEGFNDMINKSFQISKEEPKTSRDVISITSRKSNTKKYSSSKSRISYSLPVIHEISKESGCFQQSETLTPNWFVEDNEDYVRVKFVNGNQYEGPVLRKMFHGKGSFSWSDGGTYQGDFNKCEMTGMGKLTYSDLSYYIGRFCKSALHGNGTFFPALSKAIYHGNWKDGKKHGKGWLLYGPNNYYDGEWFEDRKQGLGFRYYQTGDVYNGYWLAGKPHGLGKMRFYNNDLYEGEWVNGLPHGYGEYIWNCNAQKGLYLPYRNLYQGEWKNGMRHGQGKLYFGNEDSQVDANFKENLKSGNGRVVCGDGTTVEKVPLFYLDAPLDIEQTVRRKSNASSMNRSVIIEYKSLSDVGSTPTFENKLDNIRSTYCEDVNRANFPDITTIYKPIEIPIHANPLNINLQTHIDRLVRCYCEKNVDPSIFQLSTLEFTPEPLRKFTKEIKEKYISYVFEERKLKNTLTINFLLLRSIYQKYASITCPDPKIRTIMSRLFLWQFYRDLKIYKKQISLVQTDTMLWRFDKIALASQHDPFERIFLWQFLHSILCVAFQCFANDEYFNKHKNDGIYASMLKDFIGEFILPNEGTFDGKFLFHYQNIVPITAAYELYKSVGIAHNIQTFLRRVCVKTRETPKCYYKHHDDAEKIEKLLNGENYVCNGSKILYRPKGNETKIGEKPKDPTEIDANRDEFFNDLKVFRKLGPKVILNCMTTICPVIKKDDFVVNVNYRLTFLEFMEILIELGLKMIKKDKPNENDEEIEISTISLMADKKGTAKKKVSKFSKSTTNL